MSLSGGGYLYGEAGGSDSSPRPSACRFRGMTMFTALVTYFNIEFTKCHKKTGFSTGSSVTYSVPYYLLQINLVLTESYIPFKPPTLPALTGSRRCFIWSVCVCGHLQQAFFFNGGSNSLTVFTHTLSSCSLRTLKALIKNT